MSDVNPEDKSEHISIAVTIANPRFGVEQETVIIQIHANNPLLGIAALSKIGGDPDQIQSLFQKVLDSMGDEYEDDDDDLF